MPDNLPHKPDPDLSERAQTVLRTLVERYIRDGEPVGSRTLARTTGLELSPASIRNVLADLEDAGLIAAPHTSAGRVPTASGYRLFVDSLLKVEPLAQQEVARISEHLRLGEAESGEALLASASALLSGITRLVGVVTLPRREHTEIEQIEFVPLSARRVLVILVLAGQQIQNRILRLDRDFSPAELQQAANYLSSAFAGQSVLKVRAQLLQEMRQMHGHLNALMTATVEWADQVSQRSAQEDYVLAGELNLMDFKELTAVNKLRALFDAFTRKRDILHLLDQAIDAEEMQIFIGEESGRSVLDEVSVVSAPYLVDDQVVGVLGVIGPRRMAYDRVIPVVDVTARLLGAALGHQR